ncbi:MAG: hypothetical protein KDA66_12805, partial [Planctomycetaceae bacterium]|nr:hypothetical protein [Planctomycetaceae bacterium]
MALWSETLEDRTLLSVDLSVIDINESGAPVYDRTAVVGNKLYYRDVDPRYGLELHVLDTTTGVASLVVDINPGLDDSNVGDYGGFTVVGNNLYFTAYDAIHGYELRWIDTTETTPALHTLDVHSGSLGSYAGLYGGFVAVGNTLYFTASELTIGYELRWIDITNASPILHTLDIHSGGASSFAGEAGGFTVVGTNLYFSAYDSAGHELRWIDTAEETPTLHTLDLYSGSGSSNPGLFGGVKAVGENLYFVAQDATTGRELRWIDTTETVPAIHTVETSVGAASSDAGEYGGFIVVGERLYFSASDSTNGHELRWIDTTELAPVMNTLDIEIGSGSSYSGQYGGFVAVGNDLYFTADDSTNGTKLRRVDTTESTPVVQTIGNSGLAGVYGGFNIVDRKLYFTARDTLGYELRWIDTTEETPVVSTLDIYVGGLSSYAGRYGGFTAVGGKLCFTAHDSTSQYELRWIDTVETTPILHTLDIFSGPGYSYPGQYSGFTALAERLYFGAQDSITGLELRWIDTTELYPVVHTLDVNAGGSSSNAGGSGGFATVGNKLYFTAGDSNNGFELRWVDTNETTPMLHTVDIFAGNGSSYA